MGLFKKNSAATVIDTAQPGLVTLEDGTIVHITKKVNAIGRAPLPGSPVKDTEGDGRGCVR